MLSSGRDSAAASRNHRLHQRHQSMDEIRRLNQSKTKFLRLATSRRFHYFDDGSIIIHRQRRFQASLEPWSEIMMHNQQGLFPRRRTLAGRCIRALIRNARYERFVDPSLPSTLAKTVVCSLMDYCNRLFAGLQTYSLDRLLSILNSAARPAFELRKFDRMTQVLRDLCPSLGCP